MFAKCSPVLFGTRSNAVAAVVESIKEEDEEEEVDKKRTSQRLDQDR